MNHYEQLDAVTCPKRRTRRMCAEAFGIEEHRLVGACRLREVVIPRHATYYVLRHRFPDMSFPRIGRFMGGRDHSTIIHGIRAIEQRMRHDEALRQLVGALVHGRLPEQQDAHVRRWTVEQLYRHNARRTIRPAAPAPAVDSELAEFVDSSRMFCNQCDRAVTGVEAARCTQRLCSFRVAA